MKGDRRLSAEETAAQGEDTSSVSSHGASSPGRPGSTEPPPPPGRQSSLPPAMISTTATAEHEVGSDVAGASNLPSGISVQELKKATALRMANQQQQAHLRVVNPYGYGGKRPARPSACCRACYLSLTSDILGFL